MADTKNVPRGTTTDENYHTVVPFTPNPDYVDQNPYSITEKLKNAPSALEVKYGLQKASYDSSSSVDDLSEVNDTKLVFEDIPSLHEREKLENFKNDIKATLNKDKKDNDEK